MFFNEIRIFLSSVKEKLIENEVIVGNGRNGRQISLPFLFLLVPLQPMRENSLAHAIYAVEHIIGRII